ncbi:MAG: GNAT family N-acetyltransferase [Ilyomonas sp.]
MYRLHKSTKADINNIAACHQVCFKDSLSAKLGEGYTAKTLEWFLVKENRFLFHICDEDKVIGYCGGFSPQFIGDGSTSGMLQFAMGEAIKGVIKRPWLIFHPVLMQFYPLIIRNICKRIFGTQQKRTEVERSIVEDRKIGLVVIGVHPHFRGKKVFEQLMNAFEKETAERHISNMYLSVKKTNHRAVNAYKKAGWQIEKEHDASFEMIKQMPSVIEVAE